MGGGWTEGSLQERGWAEILRLRAQDDMQRWTRPRTCNRERTVATGITFGVRLDRSPHPPYREGQY